MSATKLSMQDKKDLDKFMRWLAYKATQIIVQSRLGQKFITKCNPESSSVDWFNLAVDDNPEIAAEAKKVLCVDISPSIPLCVEISCRTVDNDRMVLESWSLGILPEPRDLTIDVINTVHTRIGILLKSLLSISRLMPAYKLSHSQGSDSFVICYRIYMGEPLLYTLGDNYKYIRVGQLCTPAGTIHLSVFYRIKMTLSPTHTSRDSIMLKSDHFHSDLSPRHARYQQSEEISKSLSDTIKVGAFVVNKQVVVNEQDLVIPDVPFSSLLTPRQTSPPLGLIPDISNSPTSTTATVTSVSALTTGTAATSVITSTPLSSVVGATLDTNNGNNDKSSTIDNATSKCNSRNGSRRSSCSITSANDDFIMVDLKTPFAGTNTNSDLGTFYRECQSAPQLQAFLEEERTLAEQVGDLTKQLETFEMNQKKYKDILTTLCQTDNNNQ